MPSFNQFGKIIKGLETGIKELNEIKEVSSLKKQIKHLASSAELNDELINQAKNLGIKLGSNTVKNRITKVIQKTNKFIEEGLPPITQPAYGEKRPIMTKLVNTLEKTLPRPKIPTTVVGPEGYDPLYHATDRRLPKKEEYWLVHAGTKRAAYDRIKYRHPEQRLRLFQLELKPNTVMAGTPTHPLTDEVANNKLALDTLAEKGYNGLFYTNEGEDIGSVSTVANPTVYRIKSTTPIKPYEAPPPTMKRTKPLKYTAFDIIRLNGSRENREYGDRVVANRVAYGTVNSLRRNLGRIAVGAGLGAASPVAMKLGEKLRKKLHEEDK